MSRCRKAATCGESAGSRRASSLRPNRWKKHKTRDRRMTAFGHSPDVRTYCAPQRDILVNAYSFCVTNPLVLHSYQHPQGSSGEPGVAGQVSGGRRLRGAGATTLVRGRDKRLGGTRWAGVMGGVREEPALFFCAASRFATRQLCCLSPTRIIGRPVFGSVQAGAGNRVPLLVRRWPRRASIA